MTKIDIFSGFLGAGKTTLIKKLIKEAYSGEKLVLVENEFGEIGVDGTFMQDAGITVNELNSGCICCSLVGDFAKALHQVIETYHPDRVLIEPSGVGKLSDVITAVQKAGVVGAELNTFTTVVDATKAKMYMKNFGEFFNNQVENASCIIFSHTDVANEKKLEEALALVKEHNPGATVILTPWDQLSGADILSAMEHKDTLEMELQRLKEEHEKAMAEEEGHHHHHHHDGEECDDPNCSCHHHDHEHEEHEHEHHHHGHEHEHDHEHDHDHDECCGHEHDHEHHHDHGECDDPNCSCHDHHHHHHADEVFTSWGKETPKVYTQADIDRILTALDSGDYGAILRAKGIVNGTDGAWIEFDYVPEEHEIRAGHPDYTGRLCVIGSNLKEEKLAELFGL